MFPIPLKDKMKKIYSLACIALGCCLLLASCGSGKELTASQAKISNLQKDSVSTHHQLDERNTQVKKLEDENMSFINDLKVLTSESKMTIADQARQLKAFQVMVQSQKNGMNKLKASISKALMNYKTEELYIYIKDGNVYVLLEENLLFKSGSDEVDPKGKEALKSLALVLNTTKDVSVMIEGHTDNVPIKTKLFSDNWDLSTARATAIVRILTKEYGLDPTRITASGRSQFHPITNNVTDEGRAGNRRTEIILSPDLKGLYGLVYQ